MNWIQINRVVHKSTWLFLAVVISAGGVYFAGYPWNCKQALDARTLAEFRLRRAQADYPPGAVYRKYREDSRQLASEIANKKCSNNQNESLTAQRNLKFFLKYRSDY